RDQGERQSQEQEREPQCLAKALPRPQALGETSGEWALRLGILTRLDYLVRRMRFGSQRDEDFPSCFHNSHEKLFPAPEVPGFRRLIVRLARHRGISLPMPSEDRASRREARA